MYKFYLVYYEFYGLMYTIVSVISVQEAEGGSSADYFLRALKKLFVAFDFDKPPMVLSEDTIFSLKAPASTGDIPFFDPETDCIVLEIQERNRAGGSLPPPFKKFSLPILDGSFHFISHSDNEHKHTDEVEFIDSSTQKTKADIQYLRKKSEDFLKHYNKDPAVYKVEEGGNNMLDNIHRFLFNTCLAKAGSGSPGVILQPNGDVAVVTMLLHGYPDWYYNDGCSDIKQEWLKSDCVEQGANMLAIYNKMKARNPELCHNVFGE